MNQGCRVEVPWRSYHLSSPEAVAAAPAFPGLWGDSIFTISAKVIHSICSPDCKHLGMKRLLPGSFRGRRL